MVEMVQTAGYNLLTLSNSFQDLLRRGLPMAAVAEALVARRSTGRTALLDLGAAGARHHRRLHQAHRGARAPLRLRRPRATSTTCR